MKGIVYKSTGKLYLVKATNGVLYKAQLKGKFKIDKEIKSSNPIAVGDEVTIELQDDDTATAIITEILPRHNYIIRVSPQNRNQKHILASNIDQVLIVASIKDPRTSYGFIDRLLVTAEAYHVRPIILINKLDLIEDNDDTDALNNMVDVYSRIPYDLVKVSAIQNTGLDELQNFLRNKSTLIMGHSGVGKSTIINKLVGEELRKTNDISDWSGKGQHTTTFAELLELPQGGSVIDTPGIKEFGIIDFSREELGHYFPEFRDNMDACKYNNCTHINEPHCAIKDAVAEGDISIERYESYLAIYDSIPKDQYG